MKIMTLNLRFKNDFDGDNSWDNRKSVVTELISQHCPSVLGTQEGTWGQILYLQKHLAGYELLAPERVWDEQCQYCSLFFRTSELRATGGGEFWLSGTPHVHKSKGWDSAYPRMLSYGYFEEVKTGRSICAAVTHLDNKGVRAREEQARIICRWLAEQECPRILMGDFNDRPISPAHKVLTENGGMFDTWQVMRKPENEDAMTYHMFQGVPQVFRMDWILVSCHFNVSDAQVIYDHGPDGRYPSDHFPYMARLAWAGERPRK